MSDFLHEERDEAIRLAWDSLARYKFWMFGYYAARVAYLGQLIERADGIRPPNPFRELVHVARARGTTYGPDPVEASPRRIGPSGAPGDSVDPPLRAMPGAPA